MDKANLIISIIIVLCIATAVAAYGIINNQDAVFSDLASMDSGSGSSGSGGIGNNTTHTGTSTGSGSGSSSGGSGSSSGTGSGSGTGGGSGSGSGGGSGGGSGSGTVHTSSQIRSIAMDHVEVSGCYAGTPTYSGGYWYVNIYNSTDDTIVSSFAINDRTGHVDLA
ncbi:endoglucanase [Methanobrevibacter sp.]|uniref:endoglucanase n=1 Tax=Methanobrevibacter sp. TaxID=66852 RepID=UPI00388DF9DF